MDDHELMFLPSIVMISELCVLMIDEIYLCTHLKLFICFELIDGNGSMAMTLEKTGKVKTKITWSFVRECTSYSIRHFTEAK